MMQIKASLPQNHNTFSVRLYQELYLPKIRCTLNESLIMYYRVAGDFLTPVIACLEHENTDLSKTALSHVAELALLMSDGEIHI